MPQNVDEEELIKTKKQNKRKRHKAKKKFEFVDYSIKKNFDKLTRRQKYYVKEMATHFRFDIRSVTQKDYNELPREMQKKLIQTTQSILTGDKYREMQKIAIDNYISALKYYSEEELANKLQELEDKLSENEKQMFMTELPSLSLFYKDKIQFLPEGGIGPIKPTHLKRETEISTDDIDFQIEQAKKIIDTWYEEKVESTKEKEDETKGG